MPVRWADILTTCMCRLSINLGASASWNPQDLCRDCFTFTLPLTLRRPPGVKYDPSLRFFFPITFFGVSYNDTNLRDFVTTGVL